MTVEEAVKQELERQKAAYLRQLEEAKRAAESDLNSQRAAAESSLSAQYTEAKDDIFARERFLDNQFAGFLTGAIAPARVTTHAEVLSRDALGLQTGSAPAPQKKSFIPLLLVAGVGYYYFIKKRRR